MRTTGTWDPTAYARYGGERTRPFLDLLARIGAEDPHLVVDLGCGSGTSTLLLAKRWPQARIIGVDSSASMLEAAREADTDGAVEWVEADLRAWDPATVGAPVDVIVTNAALQWVPGHLGLLDRWVAALAPDGWLALQVPGNFHAPSHALMGQVAQTHPRAVELEDALDLLGVGEPATYLRTLSRLGCVVDAWETTYQHVLEAGEGEHPVLTWVRSTGLRPVLDLLTEDEELEAFLTPYEAALHTAYPILDGTAVFGFRRIFAVARRLPSPPAG